MQAPTDIRRPERGRWDCHTHIFGPWQDYPLASNPAYVPAEAPFCALRALHAACGLTRGVIVQAAPYGEDHTALLDALRAGGGAYRGIALISETTSPQTLERLHGAGVRGIRLGMMKHLAGKLDATRMGALLDKIRPLGWHALVHGELPDVLDVMPELLRHGVPLVIDHMARAPVDGSVDLAPLLALLRDANVWIKLSGADRITRGQNDCRAALPTMARLIEAAPDRAIWGSDWPHVNIAYSPPAMPSLLGLLHEACGAGPALLASILSDNPSRLYG
ncbi:amidohydrolase family protein [Achromobacter spanius]|uniref:amidohydrolase family protein n=1 Tax=Achromobacter spanius TaxID=217203 RepID=UPI0038044DDF